MNEFKVELGDIEDKEQTESERLEYNAVISAVFPRIEKDIKKFQINQLMFILNESLNWEQILVGRGTFNALDLLLEHWRKAHLEHAERSKPKDDFDKNNPIGEI